MNIIHNFLFIALPYVATATFVVGFVQRYRATGFKVSSLSSQFLEGRKLFLGSMLFHIGILAVLIGHLIAFLFPGITLAWNASPVRLIVLEVIAFTFGLSLLLGLLILVFRRIGNPRVMAVTSKMDLATEFLLIGQIVLGLWIALGFRWGSSWFAADLSPYLWSIVKLNPQIKAVSAMPTVIQAHIVGAFVILGMIPFTRLIHFLVAPFHYLWRPYQLVIWNWDRKKVANTQTAWTPHLPKHN
jgi:nitrate reductase gamma subunit